MTYRENDTHSNETLTSAPYTTLRSTKVAIDIIVIQSPYKFNYLSEIWQGDCRQIVYQEDMILGSHAKSFAQSKGWWKEGNTFSFQKAYSDWLYTTMGRAASRQICTTSLGRQHTGQLQASDCFQILQTHNLDDPTFKPSKANTGSVCMHATGLLNPSNTTGSMVAEIRSGHPHTIWLTGTAHPCLSIYIPFYFGSEVLKDFKQPTAQEDDSLWWNAERLHRWIGKDYQKRKALMNEDRLELQKQFVEKESSLIKSNASIQSMESFSKECLNQVQEAIEYWNKLC